MSARFPASFCLLLAACSGADAPEVQSGADGDAEGRYGLVVLDHAYGDPGVAVSGQFMAYSGYSRDTALHALSSPENAWLLEAAPEPGQCRRVVASGAEEPAGAAIDLLGAGLLNVRPPDPLDDAPVELAPRPFPTVVFALSGVVYDTGAPQDLPYLAGGTYRVHAPGGVEVGELFAEVEAPASVRIVSHAGGLDSGLTVRWSGEPSAVVVVSRDFGARTLGVLCAGDGGSVHIPRVALTALGSGATQLVVARAERVSTTISGLDEADVLFVSRDAVELRLDSH